jgi:translation initiation factor IF-1
LVAAVRADAELDAETKATVLELARHETFLLACEDYMRTTAYYH